MRGYLAWILKIILFFLKLPNLYGLANLMELYLFQKYIPKTQFVPGGCQRWSEQPRAFISSA